MKEGRKSDDVLNWPNRITLVRIILSPVFMILLLEGRYESRIAALVVFLIASFTDMYDGYLARKYGWVTNLGKFLDPLADKLLVALAIIGLNQINLVPAWVLFFIIGREFLVTGLRSIAAYAGVLILPSRMGKYKTAVQMLSLFCYLIFSILFFNYTNPDGLFLIHSDLSESLTVGTALLGIADGMMIIAVILSTISGIDYFYRNRTVMKRLML